MTRRISVVGTSGSGKTTIAVAIARRLDVPHIEMDALYHQPDWVPLPLDEFRAAIDLATMDGGWVADGNYSAVRDIVWERADTVVWLDYPRHLVMRRLVARTLRRVVTGQELWNGNRERYGNLVDRRPEHNIILWGWTTHASRRRRYQTLMVDPAHAHLEWARHRSPAETRTWLAHLSAT